MSKIFVLIGAPASGKSTWRDAYMASAQKPTVVVSSDDAIENFAKSLDMSYNEAFKKIDWNQINDLINSSFDMAIKNESDIILDRTNMSKKSRRQFLDRLPKNYIKVAVNFIVTRDEIDRRMENRFQKTGKSIPKHVVDSMLNSYVPPDLTEFDEIIKA